MQRTRWTHPVEAAQVFDQVLVCRRVVVDHGVLFVHTARLQRCKEQTAAYHYINMHANPMQSLQRAREQALVIKRLLRSLHSSPHTISSENTTAWRKNLYIWPQEGTITQHYQSQPSSCIKADPPTFIYSLISGHCSNPPGLHCNLRKWTQPRLFRDLCSVFTCMLHMHHMDSSTEFIYIFKLRAMSLHNISESWWRGWTYSGGWWGMWFMSGEGEAERPWIDRRGFWLEWSAAVRLTADQQNRINKSQNTAFWCQQNNRQRTTDRTCVWLEFKRPSVAQTLQHVP